MKKKALAILYQYMYYIILKKTKKPKICMKKKMEY